jgi:Cdc6-like AAA superfamily ATPase
MSDATTLQSAWAGQKEYQEKLKRWQWYKVYAYAVLVFWLGVPACGIAFAIRKRTWSNQVRLTYMLLALAYFPIFIYPFFRPEVGGFVGRAVLVFWLGMIPYAPLIVVFFEWLERVARYFKPISLDEQVEELRKKQDKRQEQLSQQAAKLAETPVGQVVRGFLHLGAFIRGDEFPARLGVYVRDNRVYVEDRLIREHMLIVGTTGAGKTETLKNLIKEILWSSDRDVFIVDGKGDPDFALDMANLIYSAKGVSIPVFRLGQPQRGAVYHGFRGEPTDIYNRLCALIGVDEVTSGEGAYYADINRDLLQLICYAPEGAPESFEDVRRRLDKKWLLSAYKGQPDEEQTIKDFDERLLNGLLVRVRPLVREFAPIVDPEGFILEESRGAIFSLRTQSVGDSARRFLKFLVEDFKDFVGKRQQRPAVFVIDEFGAFGNNNITALLSLARSSDLGIVLATQDAVTLGDESTKRKILANTRTKMLMVTEYPQELAELAGTIQAIEAGVQFGEASETTGMGSARIQHQFKIDMNEAAKLETGEAFLIRQRTALKLKGARVGKVERDKRAVADIQKPQRQVEQQHIEQQQTEEELSDFNL